MEASAKDATNVEQAFMAMTSSIKGSGVIGITACSSCCSITGAFVLQILMTVYNLKLPMHNGESTRDEQCKATNSQPLWKARGSEQWLLFLRNTFVSCTCWHKEDKEDKLLEVRWLSRFFHYLDRYFIARRSLPGLYEVGLTCFRDLVYQELKGKVKDAVISLIDQEREGEHIDRALLKNVLDIFVEIGMSQMDQYENDFEAAMLKDTADYYFRKASNWILEDSCPDYMLKVNIM